MRFKAMTCRGYTGKRGSDGELSVQTQSTAGERFGGVNLPTTKIKILGLLPCSRSLLKQIAGTDRRTVEAALADLLANGDVASRLCELTGRQIIVDRRRTPGAVPPANVSPDLLRMRKLRAAALAARENGLVTA